MANGRSSQIKLGLLLAIVFLSIILFGCVQKSIYPSEKETIISERTLDTNDDGLPDEIIYIFKDRSVGSITVHRELLVQRTLGNKVVTRISLVANETDKISNVVLQEVIPTPLASTIDRVSFTPRYSELVRNEPPLTVVWSFTFGAGQEIGKTIEYTATAFQEINRAWIDMYAQSPMIEVETIDPKAVPIFTQINEFGKSIYGGLQHSIGFYLGTAIYGSLLLVSFLVLMEVAAVIFAYIIGIVDKTDYRNELLKLIGHGRKDNTVWVVLGVALVIVGAVAIVITEETAGTADLTLFAKLASNIPKLIGIALFILGIVSLYYSMADMVKGALFGERYFLSPLDVAKIRLKQLFETIDRLEKDMTQESAQGIDIETEEIVIEVERKKAERIGRELNEENAEYYLTPLMNSIGNVQSAIDSIESKHEVFVHWPEWRRGIDDLLITNDQISPEMLANVPVYWRKWALTRYMSEHLGEALAVEGGMLKKIKLAAIGKGEIELILTDFLRAGKVEGVSVIRRDGLVISSFMPKDTDQNVIAALGAKVIANAEMSSVELEIGKPRFVIIKAGGQDVIFYSSKALIIIAVARKDETLGLIINEVEKLTERMNALM